MGSFHATFPEYAPSIHSDRSTIIYLIDPLLIAQVVGCKFSVLSNTLVNSFVVNLFPFLHFYNIYLRHIPRRKIAVTKTIYIIKAFDTCHKIIKFPPCNLHSLPAMNKSAFFLGTFTDTRCCHLKIFANLKGKIHRCYILQFKGKPP